MGVLVVRVEADEVEAASDWLWQLGATAIEERVDGTEPTLVVGFSSDDAALAARGVLIERWPCRLEDTGDESEWRDVWLRYLEPIEVAGFTIHAPWHDIEADRSISIDPGRAFGSGHHPTTRLALEALREHIQTGDSVLDAGCGTGILSIGAAAMGAGSVLGIDLDHDILTVARDNIAANVRADRITVAVEPLHTLRREFNIVVANIVIGDLRPLVPDLVDRLADQGRLIVTGFLDSQLGRLLSDVEVRVVEQRTRDDWGCAVLSTLD